MARERYAHDGSVGVSIYGSSSSATKRDPAGELGSRSRFSQFKHSIETHPVICPAETLWKLASLTTRVPRPPCAKARLARTAPTKLTLSVIVCYADTIDDDTDSAHGLCVPLRPRAARGAQDTQPVPPLSPISCNLSSTFDIPSVPGQGTGVGDGPAAFK